MQLYPLKFKPIFRDYLWGGHKLREIFGKDVPDEKIMAESWEIVDLPDDKSVIANGELAGKTLREIIEKYPKEIIGDENFKPPFPLLIKFLDCANVLSVQVHPDRQSCRRMGKGDPKTECWYIISSEPGAFIYKGLKPGVTKGQFAEAINKGSVAELLAKVPVEAGQCHFLPAGTAHSIGAGILIAEIQTASDTTYRVFDWNRVDASGKSRPLHIKEALESIHFDASGDNLSVTTVGKLVDCEYFTIDKGHQAKNCEVLLSPGIMKVLIILDGFGIISQTDGISVEFKTGDTILIPAVYEGAVQFADETQYLTVTLM
ncbi:MAG: type I phosphomannose isomerase catalytic subunit [Planctomycetota bacterium]